MPVTFSTRPPLATSAAPARLVPACVTDPGRMPAAWWAWQLMVPAFVLVGVVPIVAATLGSLTQGR